MDCQVWRNMQRFSLHYLHTPQLLLVYYLGDILPHMLEEWFNTISTHVDHIEDVFISLFILVYLWIVTTVIYAAHTWGKMTITYSLLTLQQRTCVRTLVWISDQCTLDWILLTSIHSWIECCIFICWCNVSFLPFVLKL